MMGNETMHDDSMMHDHSTMHDGSNNDPMHAGGSSNDFCTGEMGMVM